MCLGRHRWQAGKGEGGPSGQEAVKASSGYEDQTAGRTQLKATAATVHRCGLHPSTQGAHTLKPTQSCIFPPQKAGACAGPRVFVRINM